jgi:hypothetical protein
VAKYRYSFDEQKLERWLREKRGSGRLNDYKPWLTIHDVPSIGLSHRLIGRKTKRLHHLLSDGEAGAFLEFDWADEVTDIREQFPLDRDATRAIAAEMGVPHPQDPKTRIDIVMTTDFLLDVVTELGTRCAAWSFKPEEELDKARAIEKLEIERRYWLRRNVPWYLTTAAELTQTRILNLRWLAELRSLVHVQVPYPDYWKDRCLAFMAAIEKSPNGTLAEVRVDLDGRGFAPEDMVTVIRHLAANKAIRFNVDAKFDITGPVDQLGLACMRAVQGTSET